MSQDEAARCTSKYSVMLTSVAVHVPCAAWDDIQSTDADSSARHTYIYIRTDLHGRAEKTTHRMALFM